MICHQLRTAFPNDPIVAEESADELLKPEMREHLKKVVDYVRGEHKEGEQALDEKTVSEWINYGNGKVGQRFWTLDPIGE